MWVLTMGGLYAALTMAVGQRTRDLEHDVERDGGAGLDGDAHLPRLEAGEGERHHVLGGGKHVEDEAGVEVGDLHSRAAGAARRSRRR